MAVDAISCAHLWAVLKIILALTYKQITEDIGALGHSEATSFAWLATNQDNEQATGCRAAIANSRTSVAAKLRNAEAIPNSANVITMNLKAL